jgi:hypothetical protein
VYSPLILVCSLHLELAIQQSLEAGFSKQGEAMQTMIGGSRMLYAAIEARYANGAAERFVIAYTCERSLRELLAAPSIVASWCPTREYAEEICRGETSLRDRSQRQVRHRFGWNTLPRFPRRYGLSSAGIRDLCSMFFILLTHIFEGLTSSRRDLLENVR